MDSVGLQYTLGLKDNFSGGMKAAHGIASGFEETMSSLKGMILGAFGAYELISFGKESVKAFEKIEHAKTQLDNALQNKNVGFSMEQLTGQAEEYSKKWGFTKESILASQLELTKFKNVSGETFKKVEELGMNLTRKFGGELSQNTNLIGRAIGDPEHAGRLLRPMGIAFSNAQTKMIRSLMNTNHVAKAQAMIFDALGSSVKGAADAFAKTAEGQKQMAKVGWEEFQESIGKTIDTIEMALLPTFESFLGYLKQFGDWVGSHSAQISDFFIGIKDATKALFGMDIHGSKLEDSFSWLAKSIEGIHTGGTKLVYLGVYLREGFALGMGASLGDVKIAADAKYDQMFGAGADAKKRIGLLGNTTSEKVGSPPAKTTASAGAGLGSGMTESKTSGAIKNITINVNQPFQNMKLMAETMGMSVDSLEKKFIEFLNSLVMDASIVSSEG